MPDSDATIRPFQPGDGTALRALWSSVGFRLIADDDDGLARFAERNPGLFLVTEVDGGIVASAMGAWDGRRGWLYHVATSPERRGRGHASAMIDRIEAGLRELGCPRALVIVERENEAAFAFWQRRGYERRDTLHLGKAL